MAKDGIHCDLAELRRFCAALATFCEVVGSGIARVEKDLLDLGEVWKDANYAAYCEHFREAVIALASTLDHYRQHESNLRQLIVTMHGVKYHSNGRASRPPSANRSCRFQRGVIGPLRRGRCAARPR